MKGLPVPTTQSISQPDRIAELEADWENMLSHQLPALPPVQEFLAELPELFSWLERG